MTKVLVIDDDPLICDVIATWLEDGAAMEVACASTGKLGAQMLIGGHFDLALIDGTLAGVSGADLAEIAANQNTPVLLLSGHPDTSRTFHEFGYPYLAKPFSLDRLLFESNRVIADSHENVRLVKASVARMRANIDALSAGVAESRRLLDELKG